MRAMATKPTSALRSLKTDAAFVHHAPILFRDVDAAGKGRFQAYLQAIPTALITDTLAALTGAALALEQAGR